jgi:hypothetical protein
MLRKITFRKRKKIGNADTNRPWEQVSIDLGGMYMVKGYSWTLLVAIDRWSRKTWEAASRKTPTSKDIIIWIQEKIIGAVCMERKRNSQ